MRIRRLTYTLVEKGVVKILWLACLASAGLPTLSNAEQGLLDWSQWYPVDRGQLVGQRAINYWTNGASPWLTGQSTLRWVAGAGLPTQYKGNTIAYFVNWACHESQVNFPPTAADCRIRLGDFVEFISQGTATRDETHLEHWTRGFFGGHYLEMYLDPITWPAGSCTQSYLSTHGPSGGPADLSNPSIKVPLILGLPATANTEWASPAVCAVVFRSSSMIASANNTWDLFTGHWFVVTKNLGYATDSAGNQIINAMNEWYVVNSAWAEVHRPYCSKNPNNHFCENGSAKTRLAPNGLDVGYLQTVEVYAMRKVVAGNPLTNGFAGYRIDPKGWDFVVYDQLDRGLGYQKWYLTTY